MRRILFFLALCICAAACFSAPPGGGDLRAALQRVKAQQRNPAAWKSLGLVYARRGLQADSVRAFQKAVALDPKFPGEASAYADLCGELGVMEEYARAITACRKAVALSPNLDFAYNNLGVVYAHRWLAHRNPADRGEAVLALRRAIQINPRLEQTKKYLQQIERAGEAPWQGGALPARISAWVVKLWWAPVAVMLAILTLYTVLRAFVKPAGG